MKRRLTATLLAGALLGLAAGPLAAQTPGGGFGPGPFRNGPPAGGGFGLMVMDQDGDREQLLLHLRLQECEPRFLGVTEGGRWRMYHPGAPDFVNRDFPMQFRAGDPFLAGCLGVRPDLRLTEADNGATVTVDPGDRIRVALESNASTGYSWVVEVAPSAAVITLVGEFYVPAASDLLGAPGVQVFDFEAIATGSTSMTLGYERIGTGEPVGGGWSANVTVR